MISEPQTKVYDRITAALQRAGYRNVRRTKSGWSFGPPGLEHMRGSARLDGPWLLLNWTPNGPPDAHRWAMRPPWEALHTDDAGWPLVKPVPSAADGFRLALQTEIQTTHRESMAAVLLQAWREAARVSGLGTPSSPEPPEPAPADDAPRVDVDVFRAVCQEHGWTVNDRERGPVVSLDVPSGFLVAAVIPCASGLRLRAEFLSGPAPADRSRDAMAQFLLRVNRTFRWVRASVEDSDGEASACLESVINQAHGGLITCDVLSSLSLACSYCAAEVPALRNHSLATAYLAHIEANEVDAPRTSAETTQPRKEVNS